MLGADAELECQQTPFPAVPWPSLNFPTVASFPMFAEVKVPGLSLQPMLVQQVQQAVLRISGRLSF